MHPIDTPLPIEIDGFNSLTELALDLRSSWTDAKKTGDGAYRFDIVLQGQNETVFLDM